MVIKCTLELDKAEDLNSHNGEKEDEEHEESSQTSQCGEGFHDGLNDDLKLLGTLHNAENSEDTEDAY